MEEAKKSLKEFLEVTEADYISSVISPVVAKNRAFGHNPELLKHLEYVELLKSIKEENFSFESLMRLLSINQGELGVLLGISKSKITRILHGEAKLDFHEGRRLKALIDLIYHGIKAHDYVVPNFIRWFYISDNLTNQTPFEDFASSDRERINSLYRRLSQKIAEVYI